MTAEACEAIRAAVDAYVEALAATAPETRTKSRTLLKNRAKAAMLQPLRTAARQIKNNPAISDADKANLGIKPAGRVQGPTPKLLVRPFLLFRAVLPLRHVLGYAIVEVGGRSKPAGAIGLQLFCHVGDAPPKGPGEARFLRFISKQPYAVDFKAEQVGQTAHYYARWQTLTGETGPWSQVLRMTVGV